MKITCLIENLVYRGGLLGEHGLSFHIQTDSNSILFDTGQTGNFIKNAPKLGVSIEDIDTVIISHGHYDHSGGIEEFCKINKKANIYCKPEIFQAKYNGKKIIGFEQFTGIDHERFLFVSEQIELHPGIWIHPEIPIYDKKDTDWTYFTTEKDSTIIPDTFEDELFISIIHNNKLSIISSCSHRGITNITRKALEEHQLPIQLILGGFHIKDVSLDRTKLIADFFKEINPERIATCHCTGVEQYTELKQIFGSQLMYFHTGLII